MNEPQTWQGLEILSDLDINKEVTYKFCIYVACYIQVMYLSYKSLMNCYAVYKHIWLMKIRRADNVFATFSIYLVGDLQAAIIAR